MRIINAGYEIFDPYAKEDIIKKIERVARVCYKSEDKITEGSAEKMVRALVKRGHYAMLEHGSIIIEVDRWSYNHVLILLDKIRDMEGRIPYIRYTSNNYSERFLVSGNCRAWREFLELCSFYEVAVSERLLNILYRVEYAPIFEGVHVKRVSNGATCKEIFFRDLTDKEKLIHGDLSVKFTTDRGISHEIVRHREASFAQESTRYCNYGNAGEITGIRPCYLAEDSLEFDEWAESCMRAELGYIRLLNTGFTPQQARAVLPTSLKTELVMTANLREWRHFFKLRALGVSGKPHPQVVEVALPLLRELQEKIPVVFEDLV